MRPDLEVIKSWIDRDTRVLDLGCGDGDLLLQLESSLGVTGLGLEIDPDNITRAVKAGLNIIEQDMDNGLQNFPDKSFDTVILAHALQAVHRPAFVLDEMLRIGREGVITFPNFGHWRCRLQLASRGRMPVSPMMPYSWYNTPNIHFCTVYDFEQLCSEKGIRIRDRRLTTQTRSDSRLANTWPNIFANTAIYRVSR
jgi:methionine biosynthesis protein MetW